MIAYSLMKGVRLGVLADEYYSCGAKAVNGIVNTYFHDGDQPELGGICLVAGLGGPRVRDGSFEYYLSEPVVKNDGKGCGPFIMTYAETLLREQQGWNRPHMRKGVSTA